MMILSGGSIVISVLVGFATAAYFLYRYYQQNKRLPPMIKYSFMDFFHEFLRGQDHRFQLKMTREHGLIYRLPFPSLIPTVAIAVSDSALARLILEGNATHQEFEKSFRYKTLDGITNGVSTMLTKRSHGEGWDSSRKAVAPSFSNINLFRLLPQLQMKLNEFKSILDTHINEQKIFNDLSSWMVRLTIDFLAKTMFDVDFGTLNRYGMKNGTGKESLGSTFSDGQEYVELLSTVIKEVTLNQGLNPLRKYMFWNKEVIAATEGAREIQSIGLKVLNKYRREHTDDDLKVDKSIIAHLLRSPYPSDRERVADVTTFIVAGHDTTAYQVSWIIIEISRHLDVLQKLRVELDSLVPLEGAVEFTPQLLSKMEYLSMVIKEGMRLWPVAASGSNRVLSQDISYGGYLLPKGATVGMEIFPMLRMGIREPDDFLPDRWMDGDIDALKLKELFIPFSTGKRGCVGQTLALLEMKLVIATLFYSYDFELISEVEELYFLTLKPQNANFKISRRVKESVY